MAKDTTTSAPAPVIDIAALRAAVVKAAHPNANILPMMADDELANLCISLRQHGFDQLKPIIKSDGKITDGRNRELACQVVNAEIAAWNADPANAAKQQVPVTPVYAEEPSSNPAEILDHVFRDNFTRRHLTSSQKAGVIVKAGILSAAYLAKNKADAKAQKIAGEFASYISQQGGTNQDYYYKLRAVAKTPKVGRDLLDAVCDGRMTVMEAHKQVAAMSSGDGSDVGTNGQGSQASPDAVLDGKKNEVREELRETFRAGPLYAEVAKMLGEIKKKMAEIATKEGGKLLAEGNNLKEVNQKIGDIVKSCRATQPYVTCPHCQGDGEHPEKPGTVCPACTGLKFLTKPQLESFEKHGVLDPDAPANPEANGAPAATPPAAPAAKAKKGKKTTPEAAATPTAPNVPAGEPAVV